MISTRARWLCAMALICTMVYLMVASSEEFKLFAPTAVSTTLLHVAAMAAGVLAGLVSHGMRLGPRLGFAACIVITPYLIFGALLVVLWTQIGGHSFLDYFVLQAGWRVFGYLITLGFLGVVGVLVGVFVGGKVGPRQANV